MTAGPGGASGGSAGHDGAAGSDGAAPESDDTGPVGPFPSWRALYLTVVVWCLSMVALLWLFTVLLNPETAP